MRRRRNRGEAEEAARRKEEERVLREAEEAARKKEEERVRREAEEAVRRRRRRRRKAKENVRVRLMKKRSLMKLERNHVPKDVDVQLRVIRIQMMNEHRNHEGADLQREEKEKGKEEVLVVGVTHRGGEAKRVGVSMAPAAAHGKPR